MPGEKQGGVGAKIGGQGVAIGGLDVASVSGAVGWKVNGAGGAGGSLTILCGPDPGAPGTLERALHSADARFKVIPTRLSDGLRVRESERS